MAKQFDRKENPPQFFKKLLRWFCTPDLLEELEGDLNETFEENKPAKGLRAAKLIYAKEVIYLLRPSVIKKLDYKNLAPAIMISNYSKVAFRNFLKNRTYVGINIISMSIGLACCIVAYLNFVHNNSFDHQHRNIDSIYRINYQQQDDYRLRHYGVVPEPISFESAVQKVTQYSEWSGSTQIGENYFNYNVGYVSPNFLDVFTFPLYSGSEQTLMRPNSIIVTTDLANRLFGKPDVVGEVLSFYRQGQESLFTIEAVLEKIPSNSSFNVDAFTSIENLQREQVANPWQNFSTTFLTIENPDQVKSIENFLQTFADRNDPSLLTEARKEYYLDPLQGMASRATANNVIGPLEVSLHWAMEVIPGVLAMFILLIACMTFTNTSIASAASRLKEIGVRKVMGSQKRQIVFQFLTESIFVCIMAILVAIPLAKVLVVEFSRLLPFLELDLSISANIGFFLFLFGLLLLTGIVAGSYPAFYLSKFQPSSILKGSLKYKSVGRLSKLLLIGQFVFSMFAITSSIMFIRNANYQNSFDLGFDTEKTIVIRFGNDKEVYNPLRDALETNPRITSLTASVDHVGRRYHTATVSHEGEEFDIVGLDVGTDYIETMDIELIQGRDFEKDRASDYFESIIINESFMRAKGWSDPIGKHIVYQDTINYYVIGMVQDFYFDSFNSPIRPLWLRLKKPEEFNYLIAKTTSESVPSVMEEMKATWRDLFNTEIEDIRPAAYARDEANTINSIILKVLIFMGGIAVVMSLIGFYSLVSLNLFGKMKEIGVRKVLGGTTFSILGSTNKEYVFLLLSGVALGAIVGHYLIPLFMDSMWSVYSGGSYLITTLSIIIMLITCLLSISIKVLGAVNKNPVLLLKDE